LQLAVLIAIIPNYLAARGSTWQCEGLEARGVSSSGLRQGPAGAA